ncbi:TPA: hypothetical protein HA265_01540, partial [Candidatus Woesearchaeota archaeon]|nr:hypothetical protein [Candidatus Woesearchaeota archaeon]
MEKEVYQKIRRVLPVLAYLLAVYFLAYTTDESIPLVLAGMMPALVNLFVLIFFDPNDKANHVIAFSAPPILGLLFIIIWNAGVSPSVTSMDGPTVAFLNVVLGYIMLVFFI